MTLGARRPVGEGLVARNALLIAFSLAAAWPPAPRGLTWLDAFTIAMASATLMRLQAALDLALANAPGPGRASPRG